MKFTKLLQNGILLSLYISRGGRVTIESASEGLGLSKLEVQAVVRKLVLAGVLQSYKGQNGGYEFTGDPIMNDIFKALSPIDLLSPKDFKKLIVGSPEHRAFAHYVHNMTSSLMSLFNRRVKNVMQELVANEVTRMDKISKNSAIN